MHITLVKKRLIDGTDCPKCADVTRLLEARLNETVSSREQAAVISADDIGGI